jgi:hypothetical protein
MGGGGSKSCGTDDMNNAEAIGKNKGYTWYGFNILSAECKSDSAYIFKKYPNVLLYVSVALAVILLLILVTRVRAD